jgi:hypothetical protein
LDKTAAVAVVVLLETLVLLVQELMEAVMEARVLTVRMQVLEEEPVEAGLKALVLEEVMDLEVE